MAELPQSEMALTIVHSNEAEKDADEGGDGKTGLRFTDLPAEMRLKIYNYYAYEPRDIVSGDDAASDYPDEDYDTDQLDGDISLAEIQKIKQTRKSLLLVSRHTSKEWAPIFYKMAKVVVSLTRWTRFPLACCCVYMACTCEFLRTFKKFNDHTKWRYVTALDFVDVGFEWWGKRVTESNTAPPSPVDFVREHHTKLPSLLKVTYSTENERPCSTSNIGAEGTDDVLALFKRIGVHD